MITVNQVSLCQQTTHNSTHSYRKHLNEISSQSAITFGRYKETNLSKQIRHGMHLYYLLSVPKNPGGDLDLYYQNVAIY